MPRTVVTNGWIPTRALETPRQGSDYSGLLSAEDSVAVSSADIAAATKGAFVTAYAERHAVDLERVYGKASYAFAYAVTWVNAQRPLGHRSFCFQADDRGWVWANRRFLAILPVDLPREANRLWTSAALKRGPNPVVVKLMQEDD